MSSSSFEAFSEHGTAAVGEDATRRLHDYLRSKSSGARLAPPRIASATRLDDDDLEQLLELACDPAVGLLEDSIQTYCAVCGTRIDLQPVRDQLVVEGEAFCASCEAPIPDVHGLPVEKRYRLTAAASAEARAWQQGQEARARMTAVILTALPEELAAVRDQLQAAGIQPTRRTVANGGLYYEAELEGRHVAWSLYATFTQATTREAAAGAVDAIMNFSPQVAIYLGIAGGIEEKGVKLGDVIAATEVFDYDGGKEGHDGYIPRFDKLHSAFALNQLAGFTVIEDDWRRRIVTTTADLGLEEPVARADPIAAGGKVIANTRSETFTLVRASADRAVAVEMEGSGFLGATQRYSGVDGIVIRGASDLIDGKSAADEKGVRKQAVANAAAFAFEMLDRFEPGR
jgi:nucleoside phosphorylase